ncbi:MAG: hypothetical protein IKK10_01830 [Clostridia bacterium]|nr:hypothetical protein [Clostridia bacterium]
MGLIKLECPSCGAHLEYSQDRDVFFCEYCGAKVIKDKQYIELSGKISIDGVATEESLLERAFLYLEDGDFLNADKYLERTLDINPRCAKAYMGKLLVKFRLKSIDMLSHWSKPLSDYDFYRKAIRFASDDEKAIYESYNQQIVERIIRKQENCKFEVEDIEKQIEPIKVYLRENAEQYKQDRDKKGRLTILLAVSFIPILVIILTMVAMGKLALAFLAIPFIAVSAFLLVKNISIDERIKEYRDLENELAELEQEKEEVTA